jgi:hypothetical protein
VMRLNGVGASVPSCVAYLQAGPLYGCSHTAVHHWMYCLGSRAVMYCLYCMYCLWCQGDKYCTYCLWRQAFMYCMSKLACVATAKCTKPYISLQVCKQACSC